MPLSLLPAKRPPGFRCARIYFRNSFPAPKSMNAKWLSLWSSNSIHKYLKNCLLPNHKVFTHQEIRYFSILFIPILLSWNLSNASGYHHSWKNPLFLRQTPFSLSIIHFISWKQWVSQINWFCLPEIVSESEKWVFLHNKFVFPAKGNLSPEKSEFFQEKSFFLHKSEFFQNKWIFLTMVTAGCHTVPVLVEYFSLSSPGVILKSFQDLKG